MEKDGVDVGGEQQPFLPQSPLLLEPASQVKELVRLHQETEKVLGFLHKYPVTYNDHRLGSGTLKFPWNSAKPLAVHLQVSLEW